MKRYILLLTAALACSPASADVWKERELIERYIQQIELLNSTLLVQAEQSAYDSRKVYLDYDAVLRDSEAQIAKLRHYLDSPMRPIDDYLAEFD